MPKPEAALICHGFRVFFFRGSMLTPSCCLVLSTLKAGSCITCMSATTS